MHEVTFVLLIVADDLDTSDIAIRHVRVETMKEKVAAG
jgi:hypothetical protein